MKKVLIALATLALLAGCEPTVKTGTVIAKKYEAPYSYVEMMCSGYNSKGYCQSYFPWTQYEPAHYDLQLRNADSAKVRTGWIEVPKEFYIKYQVGEVYP